MRPEKKETGFPDITTGNPKYRRFIEEERARKLWEEEHKKTERPIDKGRIVLAVLASVGIGLGIINSYAIAMEVWERRNENLWNQQMIQTDIQQIQELKQK